MTERKLKPCPFCGHKKVNYGNQGVAGVITMEHHRWCDRCGASTRWTHSKHHATWLWNRRGPDVPGADR